MQPDQQSNYTPRSTDDAPASETEQIEATRSFVQPVDDDQQQVTPIVTLTRGVVSSDVPLAARNEDLFALREPVRWQAKEYIEHDKNILWFVGFGAIVAGLMVIAIFLMQAWTFAVLIAVMTAAVMVYTHRPPRILSYSLGQKGLHINDHLYSYEDFKAFGVIEDIDEYFVLLIPTKRFAPGVSVYFPEEVGEQIVDILGARLPMQNYQLDFVDKLIRKMRL